MSEILKRYKEATTNTVVDARNQASGDETTAVNFFDIKSVYQDNFTVREKGDATVPLSNADDTTLGNFTPDALSHYKKEYVDLNNPEYHKYNKLNTNQHYVVLNQTAFGVSYQPTYITQGINQPPVPITPIIPTNEQP